MIKHYFFECENTYYLKFNIQVSQVKKYSF